MDWYHCEKLNEAVHRYHEQYACHSPQFEQARLLHLRVLGEIRKYFSDGPKILRHTMQPIEDGDITGDRAKYGLEFRVYFIMRPENDGALEEDIAYFSPLKAMLKVNSESELGELLARTTLSYTSVLGLLRPRKKCVNPAKAATLVSSLLQVAVDQSAALCGKVRLVVEGQAVRLEIYPDVGRVLWGRLACTVVFVPGFELNGHSYVSQSDSGQSTSGHRWCRTFAVEEQEKLKLADKKDHGCRTMVLRTLCVLCRRIPSLTGLNPYCVKTALLREMDETSDWSSRDAGRRLIGVLKQLETAVSRATLQHYYVPRVNLLSGLTWADTSELSPFGYVRCLLSSEAEMMNVLI